MSRFSVDQNTVGGLGAVAQKVHAEIIRQGASLVSKDSCIISSLFSITVLNLLYKSLYIYNKNSLS